MFYARADSSKGVEGYEEEEGGVEGVERVDAVGDVSGGELKGEAGENRQGGQDGSDDPWDCEGFAGVGAYDEECSPRVEEVGVHGG